MSSKALKNQAITSRHLVQLRSIAERHLGPEFAILDARGADSLDFHDASVVGVARALEAAYELGRASHSVTPDCPWCHTPTHHTKLSAKRTGAVLVCPQCLTGQRGAS